MKFNIESILNGGVFMIIPELTDDKTLAETALRVCELVKPDYTRTAMDTDSLLAGKEILADGFYFGVYIGSKKKVYARVANKMMDQRLRNELRAAVNKLNLEGK